MTDEQEWYESRVTKSDLYYVAYQLLACILAMTAITAVMLNHMNESLILILFALVAYSLGDAAGNDGYHRAFWSKIL